MKRAWIFIVVTIVFLIIIAGVAKADDYVINDHVKQDVSGYYEFTGVIVGVAVLVVIYVVVCGLISEYALQGAPAESGN